MEESSCPTRTAYSFTSVLTADPEIKISEQRLIRTWLRITRASQSPVCLHVDQEEAGPTGLVIQSALKHTHTLHQLPDALTPPNNKTPAHTHLDRLSRPRPHGLPKPVLLGLGPPAPRVSLKETSSQLLRSFRSLWNLLPGFYWLSFRTAGKPGQVPLNQSGFLLGFFI